MSLPAYHFHGSVAVILSKTAPNAIDKNGHRGYRLKKQATSM